MTFKILTSDTNKIIHRSSVRTAESNDRNHRADMGRKSHISADNYDKDITEPNSENREIIIQNDLLPANHKHNNTYDELKPPPKVITSKNDHTEDDIPLPKMSITNPVDLIRRNFLLDQQEEEQKFRARIIEGINTHQDKVKRVLSY